MHRQITNAPKGFEVDHINHDSLDNRRVNLRVCTHMENLQNLKKQKGTVWFDKSEKRWGAQVKYMGRRFHVGYFKNELLARETLDKFIKENGYNSIV